MEAFLSSDWGVAIMVAVGVVIAKGVAWGFTKIGDLVKGTPYTWDDKLYEAFRKALNDATLPPPPPPPTT